MSDLTIEESDVPPPVLRGWLIAFFIILIFSLLINIAASYIAIVGFGGSEDSLLALVQNGSLSNAPIEMAVVVVFDLLSPMIMVAYSAYLMRLFFRRSRRFPLAYFAAAPLVIAVFLLIALAHYLVGLQIEAPEKGAFGVIGAIVGYQYLITQSRPRKTFTL
jgi:hypothetical protein